MLPVIHAITIGNRRFLCLSPTLVRIQYAPNGAFESRRSIVAAADQQPLPFAGVSAEKGWTILDTGAMQIHTRDNDRPCSRVDLEIRWSDGKLLQIWRPGDRDYQNLGGTLRSLDRYGHADAQLDGVHPAGMESPDASATNWPAWIQCEIDPLFTDLHPDAPESLNRGHWLREARRDRNDGRYTSRTFNWYKDARKFSPGLLSASGYYLLNDSDSAVLDDDCFPIERDQPGEQDWYFFAYGRNYRQALADFRLLSGPAPMPRHQSLGIIFSRWPAFTESEVEGMVRDFAANGYPLSTLVMDMEWHKEGWGHWEFNPDLIPDPDRFFALCHKHGLEVTFNDHPLDVRDDDAHYDAYVAAAGDDVEIREREYNGKRLKMAKVDICNKQQNLAFREICAQPILDLGLDYWWNDGSRGQMRGTSGQLVCNKSSFESAERDARRGWLLARYGGFGSHRYGAFFTGDANSDWDVLRLQVEFNVRAAGVGLSHISHDIGGFMIGRNFLVRNAAGAEIIDPVRYLRWLQFGVFGPVLRFHSAPGSGSRLPYDYDGEVGGACRHWLRIRHSLLPYIYTAAHEFRQSGIPLCRPLFLDQPDDEAAYRWDEYRFGPDMLVAPIVSAESNRTFYLPPGDWYELESAKRIAGGCELTRLVVLRVFPVYVRAGSIIPRRDPDHALHDGHIDHLLLDLYPGTDGEAFLYEDDGRSTAYRDGACCRTRFTLRQAGNDLELRSAVVEGSPLGQQRNVTLLISLPQPPTAIESNGQRLDAEQLGNGRYRIALPAAAASEPLAVTISC